MFVSNTSTLILLAKIGAIRTFLDVYGKVVIPRKVYAEIIKREENIDAKLLNIIIQEGKISIIEVEIQKVKKVLQEFRMDEGEAAAYTLFERTKHKAILTDDRELIKACKLLNIPFLCAMAIVVALYEKKVYAREEAREKVTQLYKYGRYSKELYHYFLSEVK